MSMQQKITNQLTQAFSPEMLEVIDESEDHRGHGGWREGGETHFRVRMTSKAFEGESLVNRQRAVNQILAEDLKESIHALAMELRAPGE